MNYLIRDFFRFFCSLSLVCIFLAACQAAPTLTPALAPTSIPTLTLTATLTVTPSPSHTAIPKPSSTPRPSSSLTQRRSPTLTATSTYTLLPYIIPTNSTPCEHDYACVVSADGLWAAEIYCDTECAHKQPSAFPYLRILRNDGSTVWTIYCDLQISNPTYQNFHFIYTPWFFDRSGQWLYAKIEPDAFGDGGYAPSSYGLVSINLMTGQVIPMLGMRIYYEMALSPDRTRVVYTMEYTLGILNLANGEQQFISLPYVYASFIEWSPDGTQFLLVAQKNFSDLNQRQEEVVIVSAASNQPLKVVYTISQGSVIEWNPTYGIVVQTYDSIIEYGQWVYYYEWWGIDPANPTPVPIPSLTPVQR